VSRLRVLSLGAGVQSTTLLLQSCKGELPKLDAAVFADPQWEGEATYRHLDWLTAEAAKAGIPVLRTTAGDIREVTLAAAKDDDKRWASLPFFVLLSSGDVGRIRRQCTSEYKIAAVEGVIRKDILGLRHRQVAPRDSVEQWIGFSSDEMRRIRKDRNHWRELVYPLVYALDHPEIAFREPMFSRRACEAWLRQHYPCLRVPKSACIGCPFRKNEEWAKMKVHRPQEWEEACAFDEGIREFSGLRGKAFLHQSCTPLRTADLTAKPPARVIVLDAFDYQPTGTEDAADWGCGTCNT
jgi:hypothetical protein